jgi:hypothetical protein
MRWQSEACLIMRCMTARVTRCAVQPVLPTPALAEGTGVADATVGRGRHLGLAAGLCEFRGRAAVAGAEVDG